MNDTKIASKTKAQLAHFMGKVFTHFSKPSKKFVEECIYGIQASGDTKLSSIVRAIDDDIRPIYTEKRLSRNLDDETLEASVAEAVLKDGARSVRGDTLLLVDPTEIRKEFSYKMEFVTRVRDASRSSKEGRDVLVNGYHGCMVAACRPGGRNTVPLALKLWSSRSPGFKGENDEVLKIVKAVYAATGARARSYTTEGASGIRHRGRHQARVHPLRKVGAHGGEGNCGETRNGDDAAASGLRRALRHRRRTAASDAKRRKPHPETHFSLYPCGCGAFPRSKKWVNSRTLRYL